MRAMAILLVQLGVTVVTGLLPYSIFFGNIVVALLSNGERLEECWSISVASAPMCILQSSLTLPSSS